MAITRHLYLLFTLLLFTGLSINTYAGPVIVPDVVDTPLATATTTIEEEGLVVGNVTTANSDTIVAGNVISQDPAADTEVDAESAVDLVTSDGPAPVTVPNVTGLNLADATSALAADDLVVGTTTDQSNDTVPAGDVISQDPAADTEVAAGSAVDLVISTGPAPVTVPNVVNDSLAVATGKITAADLVVGTTTDQSSDTVPAGDVISQDPAADTEVEAGSAVNLVISTGPAPVTVPNVVGDTLAVATGKITAADLVVGTTTDQSSDTVTAGDVISQNPAGDTEVAAGSAVNLVISTGPATVPATVPNVVGDTLAVATGKITAADLVVGTTTDQSSDTVTAGDVISQNPAGDTEVEAGSAVNLVISTGPAPVTVPNVVGDTLAVATGKITAADLVVGTTTDQSSDTVTAGDVISQNPAGDTEVEAGSAVNLVISTGPATVPATVPNVVGDTLAVATGKITAADLVVGTTTDQSSDTVTAGDVISQNPAGDTEVAAGSAVNLVISTGPATVPATVPNVVGDTLAVATGKITAADLVVGTTTDQSSDTVTAGDVISQNPAGDTEVEAGSAVNLVISTGPAPVTVPNVVGDTLAVATGKITAADLVVGTTTDQSSDTVTAGDVISQNPAGDTEVAAGSAVNLVISTGPASGGDTVVIDDCDTGVEDPDGNIQAGIDACEADANNHGRFVRCVAIFTRELASDGVITQDERKPIMKCASHSSVGKSNISERSVGKSNISERRSTRTRSRQSRYNR